MDFPAKGYKDLKEDCPDIPADTCPLIDKLSSTSLKLKLT